MILLEAGKSTTGEKLMCVFYTRHVNVNVFRVSTELQKQRNKFVKVEKQTLPKIQGYCFNNSAGKQHRKKHFQRFSYASIKAGLEPFQTEI